MGEELNTFKQQNQILDHAKDNQRSEARQGKKTRNRQSTLGTNVKDEDAYYKLLAFGS